MMEKKADVILPSNVLVDLRIHLSFKFKLNRCLHDFQFFFIRVFLADIKLQGGL
jgi:hypothetical protein